MGRKKKVVDNKGEEVPKVKKKRGRIKIKR